MAGKTQVHVDAACGANRFANNDYGTVAAGGIAGMVVRSNDNQVVNEQFWGTYPGVQASPNLPCIWLTRGTAGNAVSALKCQGAPQGFDVCVQVLDEGANQVHGSERCG